MLPVPKARVGDFPIVAAKLPRPHAIAIRAHAARHGVPLQSIIKEAVAAWLQLNPPLNHDMSCAAPLPRAVPVTVESTPETGKNASRETLQAIDQQRIAAKQTGPGFSD